MKVFESSSYTQDTISISFDKDIPRASFVWVQWMTNSWLEEENDKSAALILSAQLRTFLMFSSYTDAGRPLMDSNEARLHWQVNKWICTIHA